MRLDTDRLTFLALAALYQIASDAGRNPIRDPAAMRFVLTILFVTGDGDRAPFDRFWRVARKLPIGPDNTTLRHERLVALRGEWEIIARSVGREPTREFIGRVLDANDARRSRMPHEF